MREIFSVTVQSDGNHYLFIRTPIDRESQICGTQLNKDNCPLKEKDITKDLLHMLSEAYHAGYTEAVDDGMEVVKRLLLESKQHRKPNTIISEKIDYRGS